MITHDGNNSYMSNRFPNPVKDRVNDYSNKCKHSFSDLFRIVIMNNFREKFNVECTKDITGLSHKKGSPKTSFEDVFYEQILRYL